MVPINNVIAFSGDYTLAVEKIFGHLEIAKHSVARALAGCVSRRIFAKNDACNIAKMWFYTKRIYKL